MIIVPSSGGAIAEQDLKIGRPASSTRFAILAERQLNYLLGRLMLGPVMGVGFSGASPSERGTYYFYSYRYPNADYVILRIYYYGVDKDGATLAVTAGTGTTVTFTIPNNYTPTDSSIIVVRAPWGSSDSGDEVIEITTADMGLHSALVYQQPKETLDTGDIYVEEFDNGRVGFQENQYITISDTAGMNAIIKRMYSAKKHLRPHAWCELYKNGDTDAPSVANGAGWDKPYGGLTFRHKAPSLYGDAVEYTVHTRMWADSGVAYRYRITGNEGTTTSPTTYNNTTPFSRTIAHDIDATSDDELELEMEVTAGTGNAYVSLCQGIKGD